jgi:hypothetical protein
VIPIESSENIELLKTLSPRIVVRRITNGRIATLESSIRNAEYQLSFLEQLVKEN